MQSALVGSKRPLSSALPVLLRVVLVREGL